MWIESGPWIRCDMWRCDAEALGRLAFSAGWVDDEGRHLCPRHAPAEVGVDVKVLAAGGDE